MSKQTGNYQYYSPTDPELDSTIRLKTGDTWINHSGEVRVWMNEEWTKVGFTSSDFLRQYSTQDVSMTQKFYENFLSGVSFEDEVDPVQPLDSTEYTTCITPNDIYEGRALFLGGSLAGTVYVCREDQSLTDMYTSRNKAGVAERYILEPNELDSGPYWVYRHEHELEPPTAPF